MKTKNVTQLAGQRVHARPYDPIPSRLACAQYLGTCQPPGLSACPAHDMADGGRGGPWGNFMPMSQHEALQTRLDS